MGPVDDIVMVRAGERWVVVEKPARVLSVPGKGAEKQACVASWVRGRFPAATGPLVVHRLDMDTSGLMVLALDAEAQRDLSRQFEERRTEKAYVAVVSGRVEGEAGEISAPMRLDVERRPVQIIDAVQGREAVTRWRVIDREGKTTRLRLEPVTGRTHQLRLHCAHIGHPILGDVLYGDGNSAERLMLHAAELAFQEPSGGAMVRVESRAPF
ncbi:MAG: RluA family pseudouridine synthase [Phycisphaerales bacterium]